MTHREFTISDLHLGHQNILTFLQDGKPLRPFNSIEEMHQTIIDNWNKTVRPVDKVYVLGDVVINRKSMDILASLTGKKCLVRGNHDIFKIEDYLKYFYEVQGVKVKTNYKMVMTHVPVHPDCLNRPTWRLNVHGHLHGNKIMKQENLPLYLRSAPAPDPKYLNVSCEQVNYTPKDLEQIYEENKTWLEQPLA